MDEEGKINEADADMMRQVHEEAFADLGEAAALDAGPEPAPLETLPDIATPPAPPPSELDVEVPDVAEPPPEPVADVLELTTDHDEAFAELGEIAAALTPKQQVRQRAAKRREQRHQRMGIDPPKREMPRQAQHNQAFIELGNVVREEPGEHADAPVPVEIPPDEARKIGERGGDDEKGAVAGAIVDFAKEDKAWRAEVKNLFQMMAREIGQQRKELDEIRGFMERVRE